MHLFCQRVGCFVVILFDLHPEPASHFLPSPPLPGLCTVFSSPCFPGYFSIAPLFSFLTLLSFLYSLFIFLFLLVLWELPTVYFGHNIPSYSKVLLSLPTQVCLFLWLIEYNLCWPYNLGCMTLWLARVTPRKKMNSPSSRNYQSPVASLLRMGLCFHLPSPCKNFVLLEFSQTFCICSQLLAFTDTPAPQFYCSHLLPLWIICSFCHLFHSDPRVPWVGYRCPI